MSQSTKFQSCPEISWVEPVLSRGKGHNTEAPVLLEPVTPQSQAKQSTTAPLSKWIWEIMKISYTM